MELVSDYLIYLHEKDGVILNIAQKVISKIKNHETIVQTELDALKKNFQKKYDQKIITLFTRLKDGQINYYEYVSAKRKEEKNLLQNMNNVNEKIRKLNLITSKHIAYVTRNSEKFLKTGKPLKYLQLAVVR